MEFKITDAKTLLRQRGLEENGPVQQLIAREALNYCAPYVPMDTGRLLASGRADGAGISYDAPYARRQYYENKGGSGQRGRLWFARMKADRGRDLLQAAARAAGGDVSK